MPSVYPINKGINKPIEFNGLKAQYIWYLAFGLLAVFLLFIILHLIGSPLYFLLPFTIGLGGFLFFYVYKLNDKYGQYGLMKKMAKKGLPVCLKSNSRRVFIGLKNGSLQ
jgi:Domain of unknown function (DUF4133)